MTNQILSPLTPITIAPGTPEQRPTPMAGDVTGSTLANTVIKVEGNLFEPVKYGVQQDGEVLTWVNSNNEWQAKPSTVAFVAAGDLSGTATNQTVNKIQGNSVISGVLGANQDGYALTWTNSSGKWIPKPIVSSGTTIFPNLGVGLATAVGLNVSGVPVRATDPTCVNKLSYIGNCDTSGNITARPRVELDWHVDNFGAVADSDGIGGGTDNAPIINSMIQSMPLVAPGRILFGAGKYRFADTVILDRTLSIFGVGPGSAGSAPGTAIIPDTGITAFNITGFSSPTGVDVGSYGTNIQQLSIEYYGKENGTTTASFTGVATNTLVAGVTASTNSTYADITGPMTAFSIGQLLIIPGAFPNPAAAYPASISKIVGQRLYTTSPCQGAVVGASVTTSEYLITLAPSGGDELLSAWKTGQMVLFPGVGQWIILDGVLCATITGSPNVTITPPDSFPGSTPGINVGDYYVIGSSFPSPVKCISINGSTASMASVSLATDGYAQIQVAMGLPFRIIKGGGTSNLSIDGDYSNHIPLNNMKLEHWDCGIDMKSASIVRDVTVLNSKGAAVAVRASHGNIMPSNANTWVVENLRSYFCHHGVWAEGVDANVGAVQGWNVAGIGDSWGYIDFTQTGVLYTSTHCSGALGWLAMERIGGPTLIASYAEGGCFSSIGSRGVSLSPQNGSFLGHSPVFYNGTWSAVNVGSGPNGSPRVIIDPIKSATQVGGQIIEVWGKNTNTYPVSWRRSGNSETATKWQTFSVGTRQSALAIADSDADDNTAPAWVSTQFYRATPWFHRGMLIGDRDSYNYMDPTYPTVFRLEARYAPSTLVGSDPVIGQKNGWHSGDLVKFNCDPTYNNETHGFPFSLCVKSGSYTIDAGATPPVFVPIAGTGGVYSVSVAGGAGTTTFGFGAPEVYPDILVCTGALTGNRILAFPLIKRKLKVYNNTTGAFILGIKTSTGTNTVIVAQGKITDIWGDGIDMLRSGDDIGTTSVSNSFTRITSDSIAIGPDNTTIANGSNSFSVGLDSQATNTYSLSIGAHNRSSAAASVAIGESCVASAQNTVAIGFSNRASAAYAAAIGSYVYADGQSSFVCGSNASATRSGEFAHGSSAVTSGQGYHGIDLGATLTATDGYLKQADGIDFVLDQNSVTSMKIRFTASNLARTKIATETHELLLTKANPVATLLSHDTVWMPVGRTFASQGWSIIIDVNAGNMRIRISPGADTINVLARLDFSVMQNLV